jgi:hypothetical protein
VTAGYAYIHAPDFPRLDLNEVFRTSAQTTLASGGQETAHSSIEFVGSTPGGMFERYWAEHQRNEQTDALWMGNEITRFIRRVRFPLYYRREKGYFLVKTKGKIAREFFNRFARETAAMKGKPGQLDLRSQEWKTLGGWFGNLKIKDVRTAALFGTEAIVGSEEWKHYEEAGDVSQLHVEIDIGGGDFRPVGVTKTRGIVLYTEYDEERDLTFLAQLQDNIDAKVDAAEESEGEGESSSP